MAFLAQSTSFCRYKLLEKPDYDFWEKFPEILWEYRFREIDNTNEKRSFGWVNIDDMLDTEWAHSPPYKGDFAAFALRLDTRRIQPAVFKKHFQLAWKDLLQKKQEQGKKSIGKQEKKDLKQSVQNKLLRQTLPVPAVFDVVWNTRINFIYLGSINPKIKSLFEEFFYHTFKLSLENLSFYSLSVDLLGEDYRESLENYQPTQFIN